MKQRVETTYDLLETDQPLVTHFAEGVGLHMMDWDNGYGFAVYFLAAHLPAIRKLVEALEVTSVLPDSAGAGVPPIVEQDEEIPF